MRTTGVNFARGSCCRALKWMAPRKMVLFGVVFALGAGSASAQLTISGPETINEGGRPTFVITIKYRQDGGEGAKNVVVGAVAKPAFTGVAGTSTSGLTGVGYRKGSPGALTEAEVADFTSPLTRVTIRIPANSTATTTNGTATGRISLNTATDSDAEDELLRLEFIPTSGGTFTPVTGTYPSASDADRFNPDGTIGQDGNAISLPAASVELYNVRIIDSQEQKFRWDDVPSASEAKENGAALNFAIAADPRTDNLGWETSLFADKSGYVFGATVVKAGGIAGAADVATVSLTPPSNDGNRTDDTVTVRGVIEGRRTDLPGLDPLVIEFEDIHALPDADKITAQAYEDNGRGTRTTKTTDSVTEGGDPVHVRVTIDRGDDGYPMGEILQVRPAAASSAQSGDFRLEDSLVEIAADDGKQTGDFKLFALADNDIGDETVTLNLVTTGKIAANGTGSVVGTFSIKIVDATEAQVEPKAAAAVETAVMGAMGSAPLNPGGDFMVDASELFTYDASAVDVTYTAAVEGDAASVSTSGDMVTVLARKPGDATVTVTAHATTRASSAVSTSQTVANTASVSFDVTVVLADLDVTLSGPEDMNITEGMSVMLTATANRAVTADTTVRLSLSGGTASPIDYSVENITIEEGETVGTTMLMATTDDEAERSETLELKAYLGNMELQTFMFTIWDAAVPALPVIAQLLLAAFLAIGGYRRYLRRR